MSDWIKISDRKPSKSEYPVLTWNGQQMRVAITSYNAQSGDKLDGMPCADKQSISDDQRITHWMLAPAKPEPPKPREWWLSLHEWPDGDKAACIDVFEGKTRPEGCDSNIVVHVREVLEETSGVKP